ncbi:MAG: Rne/Rng family ribonuclease, partial [Polyangiaceae bacterium]
MAKNILVISCDLAETRVALIENGIIAELHIERRGAGPRGGTVGDIFLGKVTRVLPGLQAAFIDIGLERAAFLHVEDLIRPDDFEAYLAGGRKHALGTGTSENGQETPNEAEAAADEAAEQKVAVVEEQAAAVVAGDVPEAEAVEAVEAVSRAGADEGMAGDMAEREAGDDADAEAPISGETAAGDRSSDAGPESGEDEVAAADDDEDGERDT